MFIPSTQLTSQLSHKCSVQHSSDMTREKHCNKFLNFITFSTEKKVPLVYIYFLFNVSTGTCLYVCVVGKLLFSMYRSSFFEQLRKRKIHYNSRNSNQKKRKEKVLKWILYITCIDLKATMNL